MRKVLFVIAFATISFNLFAQDALKVNFKPESAPDVDGWESVVLADKAFFEQGFVEFNALGGVVSVEPVFLITPEPANVRSINRAAGAYTGDLAEVMQSWIGVDSRYENDCDVIGIKISGLPAATYTFKSYHMDLGDQCGSFISSTSVNGTTVHEVEGIEGDMISHTASLEDIQGIHSDLVLTADQEIKITDTHVVETLDSITSYVSDQIVVTDVNDEVLIQFMNILPASTEMPNAMKIILVNGFELSLSENQVGINDQSLDTYNISIANLDNGVRFTGENISEVEVYSVSGQLVNSVYSSSNSAELNGLQKGVYIAKIKLNQGISINKKFVVR